MQHDDKTGNYSDEELEELNEVTAFGGTTPSSWTCGTFLSTMLCPTTSCTTRCPR